MHAPLNEADPSTPWRFLLLVTGGSFLAESSEEGRHCSPSALALADPWTKIGLLGDQLLGQFPMILDAGRSSRRRLPALQGPRGGHPPRYALLGLSGPSHRRTPNSASRTSTCSASPLSWPLACVSRWDWVSSFGGRRPAIGSATRTATLRRAILPDDCRADRRIYVSPTFRTTVATTLGDARLSRPWPVNAETGRYGFASQEPALVHGVGRAAEARSHPDRPLLHLLGLPHRRGLARGPINTSEAASPLRHRRHHRGVEAARKAVQKGPVYLLANAGSQPGIVPRGRLRRCPGWGRRSSTTRSQKPSVEKQVPKALQQSPLPEDLLR